MDIIRQFAIDNGFRLSNNKDTQKYAMLSRANILVEITRYLYNNEYHIIITPQDNPYHKTIRGMAKTEDDVIRFIEDETCQANH